MTNTNCRSNLDPNKRDKKGGYVSVSALKERGWTKKMVDTILKVPDKTETNPVYKSAPPMKLYSIDRVKRAERTKKFKEELEKAKKRRASSRKASETKTSRLKEWAKVLEVKIPLIDQDRLVEAACKSYNEWMDYQSDIRGGMRDYVPASKDSESSFLSRICRNYIRHRCTTYEEQLEKMYGKAEVQEAHDMLQKKINEKIDKMYPFLCGTR